MTFPAAPEPPSPFRFYTVVTVPAAALMALEIVSSRLLAPHFGNSVYVWGSIIGVFLAVMSAGYWWGGRLADRNPEMEILGTLLTGSCVFQAAVLISGRPATEYLGTLTGGAPSGVLLATALLFGPPTVFLAMVSPFAVKIAARDLGALGGTAGHLFALSTAGSLAGTLGATFFLIPRLALEAIFSVLLVATAVSALLAIGPGWKRRKPHVACLIAVLVVAFLPRNFGRTSGGPHLVERLSPYQTLTIRESGPFRYLYSDGVLHAAVDLRTGLPPREIYTRDSAAAFLVHPDIERVLVLGMGGGGAGTYLTSLAPEIEADHVEVDQAVADLAREYLDFREDDRNRVHIEDARRFLTRRTESVWDYIYVDTYIGHSIPFHLTTREFFSEVATHLSDDGVVAINSNVEADSRVGRALLRSLRHSFRQIYVFRATGGSSILIATRQTDRLTDAELGQRAEELDRRLPGADPGFVEMVQNHSKLDIDLGDAVLLTDRFAPVNDLLRSDRLDMPDTRGREVPAPDAVDEREAPPRSGRGTESAPPGDD